MVHLNKKSRFTYSHHCRHRKKYPIQQYLVRVALLGTTTSLSTSCFVHREKYEKFQCFFCLSFKRVEEKCKDMHENRLLELSSEIFLCLNHLCNFSVWHCGYHGEKKIFSRLTERKLKKIYELLL